MSQIYKKNTGGSSGGIVTIDGDVGSVTGTTVDLFAHSGSASCGSSVSFTAASATEMDLVVTDASSNTIVGQGSGSAGAILGSSNTGFGTTVLAELNNASAQFNTAVGYTAMFSNVAGSDNTCVGAFSFTNGTGSGNTALGLQCLSSAVNANNNTCVGNSSLQNLGTGGNNIVISDVNGASSYTTTESSNIIIGSIGVIGDNNTIRIGTQGSSTSEQDACYIAGIAGVSVSNLNLVTINTSTGQLGSEPSSVGGITTIDGDSGGGITGSTVTIYANTSSNNCGSSVSFSTSGTTSTLNVTDSNSNTIIGGLAGNSSVSGTSNVGVGYEALHGLTSGTGNVSIGLGSLQRITTGSDNTCIGVDAGLNYSTGSESNNILLGAAVLGTASESNVIRIGNNGSGSGQQNKCFVAGIAGITVTGSAVLCSATGQLGDVSSSIRFKENIESIIDSSDLYGLNPVSFNYKYEEEKTLHYGLIAEEVDKVMPNLVIYDKDNLPYSIKYHEMPALLLVEIKNLKSEIEELKKIIIKNDQYYNR